MFTMEASVNSLKERGLLEMTSPVKGKGKKRALKVNAAKAGENRIGFS